jgi:hypothetical protein
VIIDLLMSKDGLRLQSVDVKLSGVRVVRGNGGFMARVAERIDGSLRLYFDDLTAALARPEIVDQLMAGVAGLARPEITLANGENGSVRLIGSVEALGRRIPITTSTRVHIDGNRLVISATHLEGLPLLRAIPLQLLDLVLPLSLPQSIRLTEVTTAEGCFIVGFEGTDVPLTPLSGDGDGWVF